MSITCYSVLVPDTRPSAELVIRRSRFIGFAGRVDTEEQARDFLTDIRRAHRGVRHVCHAFVLGSWRATQRSSDDGEPAGTAGGPILKAILTRATDTGRADLSDVVVAVVRYFGGIKLGTGGLVQAYSATATQTLEQARLLTRQRMRLLVMSVPIGETGRLDSVLRASGIRILATDYLAEQAVLQIAVPDEPDEVTAVTRRLATWTGGRISAEPGGRTQWFDLD